MLVWLCCVLALNECFCEVYSILSVTDNLESIVRQNYYKTYIYVYNNVSHDSYVYQFIQKKS